MAILLTGCAGAEPTSYRYFDTTESNESITHLTAIFNLAWLQTSWRQIIYKYKD